MADAPTNTLITSATGVVGVDHRTEDLSDIIHRIDPEETPVYSGLSKGKATGIKHDWTVQELQTVDGTKAAREGFEPDYEALKVPDRFTNATQIKHRAGLVSGTYDSVDTVGGSDRESTRQKVLKGLEVRRDVENEITRDQATVHSDATGRLSGSIPAWMAAANTKGTYTTPPSGDGTTTPVPGATGAFNSIALIDDALLAAYIAGGKPKVMYMSPYLKTQFSKIPDATAGAGSVYVTKPDTSRSQFQFVGSADMYHSDWGPVEVAPSIHMAKGRVLCIDPSYMKYCPLPRRSFAAMDLAKTGDSKRFMVLNEGCIEASAPKAHAMVGGYTDP